MGLIVKRRVTLDLSKRGEQVSIPFSLGDRVAYEVIFTIRDGAELVELPVGVAAAIAVKNGYKSAGCLDSCKIDHVNNNVIYTPTVEALAIEGNIECTLHLFDINGAVIGAPTFLFAVSEGDNADTEEEVSDALEASSSWGIIAATASKAEAAAQSAKDAEDYANRAKTALGNATLKASEAEASAGAALAHQRAANINATNAATSAGAAATSAGAAATSAGEAATSAGAAATSEENAATSAGEAATSEENAATSAGEAATSAGEAATSAEKAARSELSARQSMDEAEDAAGKAKGSEESCEDMVLGMQELYELAVEFSEEAKAAADSANRSYLFAQQEADRATEYGTLFLVQETGYDERKIMSQKAATEAFVSKNTLPGQINAAIAKVVADAPEDFDTLKEIADYIASDKTHATEINNKLSEHAQKIASNENEIGDLSASVREVLEKSLEQWGYSCSFERSGDSVNNYIAVTIQREGNGALCFDLAIGTPTIGLGIYRINSSELHGLYTEHSITRLSVMECVPIPVALQRTETSCTFFFHDIWLSASEVYVNDLGSVDGAKIVSISAEEVESLPTTQFEQISFYTVVDSAEWERIKSVKAPTVVHETGDREDAVMSQKASTDAFVKKADKTTGDWVYIIKSGVQGVMQLQYGSPTSYSLAARVDGGALRVGTPVSDADATPKKYVEDHFPRYRHNVYFDICPDGDVNVSASIMFTYYSTSDAEIGHTITDFYNFIANDCDGVLACSGTLSANNSSGILFGVEASGNMIHFNASTATAAIEVIDSDFYCEYSYEAVKQV